MSNDLMIIYTNFFGDNFFCIYLIPKIYNCSVFHVNLIFYSIKDHFRNELLKNYVKNLNFCSKWLFRLLLF